MLEIYIDKHRRLLQISTLKDNQLDLAGLIAKQACNNSHEFIAVFQVNDDEEQQPMSVHCTSPRHKYSEIGDAVHFMLEQAPPRWGRLIQLWSPHQAKNICSKSLSAPVILAGVRERTRGVGYHKDSRSERALAFNDLAQQGILKYAS